MSLLLFLSCDKPAGDSNVPPLGGDDSTLECFGNDPVINEVALENGGVQDFEGTPYPTILIWADTEDADGNLDVVTMEIWWDETPDGAVDTSGTAAGDKTWTPRQDSAACNETAENLGLYLQVGGSIPYDTEMDFAVRITDSEAEPSNIGVATGWTPTETGDDGGGE
ncbi:MAG TPA: hypothetical protein QGF58_15885 [Myxococcota bacterium]|nr:hypothetical protein [Myxococcota bacterium]